jgi:hypothetical protein
MRIARPWIYSAAVDGALILAPAWLITAIVVAFPRIFAGAERLSGPAWLLLIVGFDVAHVYSTLFRTYFDARERAAHGALLMLVPLLCWIGATMLYAFSAAAFWSVLAYFAVFHFVRQQYGLVMLYATPAERENPLQKRLDAAIIYSATVYPLIYWQSHLPRAFVWFVDGDFLSMPPAAARISGFVYAALAVFYMLHELWHAARGRPLNLPKQALIFGTAASWYTGIVAFNADLAFTATNVLAHAIPYFALVWIYGHNRELRSHARRPFFTVRYIPILFIMLAAFAYVEEGMWDGFVWREHGSLFPGFSSLPSLSDGPWLAFAVPVLILPQLTHYVMDAFIWRLRSDSSWRETLLFQRVFQHASRAT